MVRSAVLVELDRLAVEAARCRDNLESIAGAIDECRRRLADPHEAPVESAVLPGTAAVARPPLGSQENERGR